MSTETKEIPLPVKQTLILEHMRGLRSFLSKRISLMADHRDGLVVKLDRQGGSIVGYEDAFHHQVVQLREAVTVFMAELNRIQPPPQK